MIEKTVLGHLSRCLEVKCYMERPPSAVLPFVLVEKTGSSRNNYLESATFAIQSYGRTMLEAAELNQLVKNAMNHLADSFEVSACHLNSDYNFTDTRTKEYRYQAVFDISYWD